MQDQIIINSRRQGHLTLFPGIFQSLKEFVAIDRVSFTGNYESVIII